VIAGPQDPLLLIDLQEFVRRPRDVSLALGFPEVMVLHFTHDRPEDSLTAMPDGGPEAPFRLEACPKCGYDVRALSQGHRCPECGQAQDEASFHLTVYRPRSTARLWVPIVAALLLDIALSAAAAAGLIEIGVAATFWAASLVPIAFVLLERRPSRKRRRFLVTPEAIHDGWGLLPYDQMPWACVGGASFEPLGPDRWRLRFVSRDPTPLYKGIGEVEIEGDADAVRWLDEAFGRRIREASVSR
jgi:hypothetical protein